MLTAIENFLSEREFISGQEYCESLEACDRLSSFLNPARPPSSWEPYTLKALWKILAAGCLARKRLSVDQRPSLLALNAIGRLGLTELQKTLLVGHQYRHNNGLFYGSDRLEDITAWLQERLPVWVDGGDLTLHIDFHTGLGKHADYKLLIDCAGANSTTRETRAESSLSALRPARRRLACHSWLP